MASYQNFIATISNSLTFNLKSEDGRYVRLNLRTITVNGVLQNRQLLNLNNDPGQAATLILKDFPNTDNFNLFIETRTAESVQEFPINIIRDEVTGAQFLQVDDTRSGLPLRVDPDVSPGVIVQFAEFRVFGEEPTPTIVADAFGFLRIGGGASVPRFGFEAVLPNINITTVVNWRPILPFILNGGSLVGQVQQVEAGLSATIIGGIVGGVVLLFAIPVIVGSITTLMVLLNKTSNIPVTRIADPPRNLVPALLRKPILQYTDQDYQDLAAFLGPKNNVSPDRLPTYVKFLKNIGANIIRSGGHNFPDPN